MITVSKNKMDDNDFDNLYNSRLLPVMDQLRAECRKANKWATVGLLSFVAFMVYKQITHLPVAPTHGREIQYN